MEARPDAERLVDPDKHIRVGFDSAEIPGIGKPHGQIC